jgi:hypothetical protein
MLHRIVSRSAVVLAATAFLASCEDNTSGTPNEPPPGSTAVVVRAVEAPDSGVVDTDLAEPVVVKVTNPDGTPATSVVVTFGLTTGGLLEHTQVTTDANGLASPGIWHLGKKAGNQRLTATPPSGDPAIINVTAVPGPFKSLDAPSGLPNSAQIANQPTAIAPVFVAVDSFGNRVFEPVEVTFEAVEGTIDDTDPIESGENGDVSPGAWTLDGTIGLQRLVAVYDVDGTTVHDTITVEAVCSVTRANFGVSVNGQWRLSDCDNGTNLVNVYSFAATTQTAYNASISGAPGQALQLKTPTGTIIQDVLPSYLYSTTSNPYSINYVLQTGAYESWALAPGLSAILYSGILSSFGDENGEDDYLPPVGCAEVGNTPFFATKGLDAFNIFRTSNTCSAGGYATYQDRYLIQLSAGEKIRATGIQSGGQTDPAATVLSVRIRDARTAGGAVVVVGAATGTTGAAARTIRADYTVPAGAGGLYEVIVGSPIALSQVEDDDGDFPNFEYELILGSF